MLGRMPRPTIGLGGRCFVVNADWKEPLFNPNPRRSSVDLGNGARCIVIDDALLAPERLVAWASAEGAFAPPSYPYPGTVATIPASVGGAVIAYFDRMLRESLGCRRQLETRVRLSVTGQPAETLKPIQWLCHRDRIDSDAARTRVAASVLYLFHDPRLGGTDFYRSRLTPQETDQLVADSQRLDAAAFSTRYGLSAGYMAPGNPYFDHVARVPAAWNRLIAYDGSFFHSAAIDPDVPLPADPTRGRLTLNGFYTCSRPLGA
jgi:Family of unknown function (DUF6445)